MVTRILSSDKPRQPAHKFAKRSLRIGSGCVFSRWEGKDRGTGTRLRAEEKQELKRRELAYRGSYSELEVRGKAVILIDDGIATGSTMRAAVCALNAQHPALFIVAVPTAADSVYRELRPEVD